MVRHLLGTAAAVTLLTGPAFAQDTAEGGAMTVQQCAPVVTVTQTPPKVTVTMPEDANADPMVTVSQSAPEVTVENCAPTVMGADGEQIEAKVTEAEANVTINAAETAELTVTRMGAAAEPAADEATAEEPAAGDAMAEEADPKDQMGEAPEGEEAATEAEPAPEAEVEPASDDIAAPMTEAEDGPEAAVAPESDTMPTEAMPESDPQAPDADAATEDTADEAVADAATTEVAPSSGEVTASANAIALREGSSLVEADEVMAEGMDGTPVYSADDEEVGSIEMFDTDSEAAIIGVGGFLGLGEKNVALPLADLSFQRDEDGELRAYIATASDQIEALPEHKASE
ncbi:PRC-barrel domain-containing protein [Paracoccus sp. JM45]|uniref:PRC-barrel domain-containing protein n=1 Tax=Paracoccus sp. JM45 TaxID=2283626 RepID=UPI000E6CF526|nr:PRC-barrel domain-containing protein [Paracoccus sp. JM45]RJE81114.1 hypothetical protein DWB67_00110 [Paracoccus sp. JM45]